MTQTIDSLAIRVKNYPHPDRKEVSPMPRKIGRDAGTGKFIPLDIAKRRPATTTVETLPKPKKK